VTGRWDVFLSSSTTLGSLLRSFLHATRMIGSPGQKCITSEIHYERRQHHLFIYNKKRQPYLLLDVIQRIRGVNRKADEDDMRVGVRQGTESVVVLLSGRIPESELDVLTVDFDVRDIVLEHGRHVHL
jgi:hypothetical protein